jgi:hypothetical protein
MVTAEADDVRIEIETYLDDAAIEGPNGSDGILARVERDLERELTDPPDDGTADRRDLEAVLAALFIATTRDRAEESVKSGRTSTTYEQSLIDQLRARAKRLGATDELVGLAGTRRTASITAPDAKNWEP